MIVIAKLGGKIKILTGFFTAWGIAPRESELKRSQKYVLDFNPFSAVLK